MDELEDSESDPEEDEVLSETEAPVAAADLPFRALDTDCLRGIVVAFAIGMSGGRFDSALTCASVFVPDLLPLRGNGIVFATIICFPFLVAD
mmetsp:Transcript_2104/g.4828  ORF Transcript_2104/g.4828 Transcript_2104/m.4828 type:complete len:92 (+) Transcript_2104:1169-1444(+)